MFGEKYNGGGSISSAEGTGVGATTVEYCPLVKFTGFAAFHKAVKTAVPYGSAGPLVEAGALEGTQLPHVVEDTFPNSELTLLYGRA